MNMDEAYTVREVLQRVPQGAATSVGNPPSVDQILFLSSHAAALDPDVSLVIGNRGMGKTFWATALSDEKIRFSLSKRIRHSRLVALERYAVAFGFSDRQGRVGVSATHVARHMRQNPEDYWRAVLIKCIHEAVCPKLDTGVNLDDYAKDPDLALLELARIDNQLSSSGPAALILFDQLDQLADDWGQIQKYTKGILRIALACKSYRSIRIKVFMRPDQAADESIFRFSDSSKIQAQAAHLRWYAADLFGLLFKFIWANADSKEIMLRHFGGLVALPQIDGVPFALMSNPDIQRTCFDRLAGTAMGSGAKRGRPYTWIITHLADGRQQISPRSFLTAIRVAADHLPKDPYLVFDYKGIQEGVAAASNLRRDELQEDYPWISDALNPLHGITVPIEKQAIYDIWSDRDTASKILSSYVNAKAPVEIVTSPSDPQSLVEALERALVQLGVFEERTDTRVNVPDIFRISAGMKRKGGVPPQRRRGY